MSTPVSATWHATRICRVTFSDAVTQAPTDLKLRRQSRELEVGFPDGSHFALPCELLRVFSPSAEVRGHGPGERRLMTGKKYVNIERIELVGNYAIRIVFDDGHDTGIYAWEYLRELGEQRESFWQRYLEELKVANASRLPSIPLGHWQPDKGAS
jgi:DUF971 family protein